MYDAYRWVTMVLLMAPLAWGQPQIHESLVEDGFEGSLGNWAAANGAGLYSGTNYASVGTGAAQIPRTCGNPTLTLIESLPLNTQAYTNLTITFDYHSTGGGGTVRWNLQYSENSGTNWNALASFSGSTPVPGSYSNTLHEGSYTFTDQFTFRFVGGCQSPTQMFYVDEMKISGFPKPYPGMVIQLR